MTFVFTLPVQAGGDKVYTNEDLPKYYRPPILNKETVTNRDQEIREWERQNRLEVMREKEELERQQKAEEARKSAERDKKQNTAKKRT